MGVVAFSTRTLASQTERGRTGQIPLAHCISLTAMRSPSSGEGAVATEASIGPLVAQTPTASNR